MVKKIKDLILDLIFPKNIYCICCDGPIDNRFPYSMCPGCVKMFLWTKPGDIEKSIGEKGDGLKEDKNYDGVITCASYGSFEKKVIHDLKYKDKSYVAASLSQLMEERLSLENLEIDFLTPVPMYIKKEKKRGYNQAALLARGVADRIGLPCYGNLLLRIKDTRPMSQLSEEDRRENVKGVFKTEEWVTNKLRGQRILLVDDVFTTGNTAEACAEVLKKAGAEKVYVLAFAGETYKEEKRG